MMQAGTASSALEGGGRGTEGEEALAQFTAPTFTRGKIPDQPPPPHVCVW